MSNEQDVNVHIPQEVINKLNDEKFVDRLLSHEEKSKEFKLIWWNSVIIPVVLALISFAGIGLGLWSSHKTTLLSKEVQRIERNSDVVKTITTTIMNSSSKLSGKDENVALLHYIALYEMVGGLCSSDSTSDGQKKHLMSSVIRMGAVIDKKGIWEYLLEKSNTDRGNFSYEDIEFIKTYAEKHLTDEMKGKNEEKFNTAIKVAEKTNPMIKFIQENPVTSVKEEAFRTGWIYIGPIDTTSPIYKTLPEEDAELTSKLQGRKDLPLEAERKTIDSKYSPTKGEKVKAITDIYFRSSEPIQAGKSRVLGPVVFPVVKTGEVGEVLETRYYKLSKERGGLLVVWSKVTLKVSKTPPPSEGKFLQPLKDKSVTK